MLTIHIYQNSIYNRNNFNSGITHYPEIGLMPHEHVKIANRLAEKVNSGETITIETASEIIIRKLQVLVALGKINKDLIEIVFHFNTYLEGELQLPEGERETYKCLIEEDGSLTRTLNYGFFEIADNLSIMLYQIAKKKREGK
jgi:hypothetical protein